MARGKLTIRGKRTPENVRKEIQEKILARLMSGEHLTAICRSKEMPELKSIYQWLQTDAVFAERYSFAREVAAQIMCDEIVEIADNCNEDWTECAKLNKASVERAKIMIDARKWTLATTMPRRYGNKSNIEISGKDGGAITMANAVIPIDKLRETWQMVEKDIEYDEVDSGAAEP